MTTCICPTCGTRGPLSAFSGEAASRQFDDVLAQIPGGLGKLVLGYMALFAPGKKRSIGWPRALDLLTELSEAIHAQSITYRRQTIPAPPDHWRAALREMLDHVDRLSLPMSSHGYLIRVLVGLHERSADRIERDRDAQLRAGRHRALDVAPNPMIPLAQREIAARNAAFGASGKPPLTKEQEARIWRDYGVEPPA